MENITNFNFKELNRFNKIYILVSGGIDSTYLLEIIKQNCLKDKIYVVNCFNPYEQSNTLDLISIEKNFISIIPQKKLDYGKILKNAFLKIPLAKQKKIEKKYSKKDFGCCRIIKHQAFLKNSMFKESNTVVISGIKRRDGFQRAMFLMSLVDGKERAKGVIIKNNPTFYHVHKSGMNYCYPFRDFDKRELPNNIINILKEKYPLLEHSGCSICPVMVLFENRIRNKNITKKDSIRLKSSIQYAKNLGVY